MTDRDPSADADSDSLTRAFDSNRESVESFVTRLDTADELLGAALRSARTLRSDAGGSGEETERERPSADTDAPPAAGSADTTPPDGPATDEKSLRDVVGAVETVAELHREGALSGVTDAVGKEDVVRGVEAFLDAYGNPEVDGGMGYLVAVANGLADRDEREAVREAE